MGRHCVVQFESNSLLAYNQATVELIPRHTVGILLSAEQTNPGVPSFNNLSS